MNWESFIANPETHISKLSEIIQAKLSINMFGQLDINGHSFGGNSGVNNDIKLKTTKIKKTSNLLPEKLLLEAQKNHYANIVYERMMQFYRQDFHTK